MGVAVIRSVILIACALMAAAAPDDARAQSKTDQAKEKARMDALRAKVRSYRCVTKAGRKYYGSTIPQQCTGSLVEALSSQGTVLFHIDPPLTPEQRAAKEAEEKKAAQAEEARLEARRAAERRARRDMALLQTYADENDIERVRQRALAANLNATRQVEARIAQLKKRQAALAEEVAKREKLSAVPGKLQQDVRAVAYDLSLQEQLLVKRKEEAAEINARYDDEKRKYRELTRGRKR